MVCLRLNLCQQFDAKYNVKCEGYLYKFLIKNIRKHVSDIKEDGFIMKHNVRMERLKAWNNIYPDICRESLGEGI